MNNARNFIFAVSTILSLTPVYAQQSQRSFEVNSCVSCHLEIGEELALPVQGMENDVHAEQGLSCADCHGGDPKAGLDGDPEAAMDPAKGYIGVPRRTEIPRFCARCHSNPSYMKQFNPRVATDQYDRYLTSVHGQRLKTGDEKVAVCTDCHGVHGIRNAKDSRSSVYPLNIPDTCGRCHGNASYMEEYGIPTNQVAEYKKSVHGKALLGKGDLAAPACNDCHGNHGATPPGAPSVAYVCGQCHLNNSELFFKSPHYQAFLEMDLPECETCHGNHDIEHPSDELLGVGPNSICLDCHDEGTRAYDIARTMYLLIDSLKTRIAMADSLISKAERAGMPVNEAKFKLHDADDALIKARTMIHSLSVATVEKVINKGVTLTNEVITMGKQALAELQFRRKGLAISIVFILILALGLFLKIKEVDQKYPIRTQNPNGK